MTGIQLEINAKASFFLSNSQSNRRINKVGIGRSEHPKYERVTVVIFAGDFAPFPKHKPKEELLSQSAQQLDSLTINHRPTSSTTSENWPPGAISMKQDKSETVKNGKKVIKTTQIFLMDDGTTEKRERTQIIPV